MFVYIFQVADAEQLLDNLDNCETNTNSFLNWIDSCDDHNYNHDGSKSIKKDFFCEYCLKKFSKLTDVKEHIVNEHNDKIDESKISTTKKDYLCEFCLKKFPKISDVKQHILDEHEENPKLHCDKCNKDFESTRKLKKHLHGVHMKDKECPQCGKFFTGRGLVVHIESHHIDKNVRNHQCPHCSFNTYAKRYLQSHILTVHDESSKKLICEKCSRRFRFPDLLRRHNCCAITGKRGMKSMKLSIYYCFVSCLFTFMLM